MITKYTTPRIVLRAGTTIPGDTILIDDLVTSRDKQSCIELPICVGNSSKMLYNLKITHPDGFPINSPVKLVFEINADKLLLVHAECMGVRCAIEPQNPFANKELTTKDRIVLAAERQVNLEAERNGGIPTKSSLAALRDAYIEVGNDFRAAETWELQIELYPSQSDQNGIGVLYANAGNSEKAQSYFKKAIQPTPQSSSPYSTVGFGMKHKDPEPAKPYF